MSGPSSDNPSACKMPTVRNNVSRTDPSATSGAQGAFGTRTSAADKSNQKMNQRSGKPQPARRAPTTSTPRASVGKARGKKKMTSRSRRREQQAIDTDDVSRFAQAVRRTCIVLRDRRASRSHFLAQQEERKMARARKAENAQVWGVRTKEATRASACSRRTSVSTANRIGPTSDADVIRAKIQARRDDMNAAANDKAKFDASLKLLWSVVESCGTAADETLIETTWTMSSSNDTQFVWYEDGVRNTIKRSAYATCKLPLGRIVAPCFRFEKFRSMAQQAGLETEDRQTLFNWLDSPTLADRIKQHPQYYEQLAATRHKISRCFANEDIDLLLNATTVEETDELTWVLNAFKVPKASNEFSRFIADGRPVNIAMEELGIRVPDMELPNLRDVIDAAIKYDFAFQADATSFFYQFLMHPSLRALYGVTMAAKRGRFKRLRLRAPPMGAKWVPAFAQAVSKTLCELVSKNVQGDFIFLPWIDNFFCFAESQEVAQNVRAEFVKICDEVNMIVTLEEVARSIDLLGMRFNLETHEVSLTDTGKDKLRAGAELLERRDAPPTGRELLAAFGRVSFINFALRRMPLAFENETMSMVRDVCRAQKWDERISETPAIDSMAALMRKCIDAKVDAASVVHRDEHNDCMAWSDASNTHIGGILQQALEDVDAWSQPRTDTLADKPAPIFIWEFIAAAASAIRWEDARPALFAIDNTAAYRAFLKGHSGSRAGDAILREVLPHMSQVPSFAWVDTDHMRADYLTRPDELAGQRRLPPVRMWPGVRPSWTRVK